MRKRSVWLALAGVLGLACLEPTDGCGCPPTPATAVVFGRVQTTSGAPVAQAPVSAYIALSGNCSRQEFPDGASQTRSDGTYRVGIAAPVETDSTCVLVHVQAPFGSGLSNPTDTIISLAFRYEPPWDSARVDATLGAQR
jgi:hypothetical protein